jgi:hypothetical protein
LPQRKGDKAKKQGTSKQAQPKPNSKAGQLVGYIADLQDLRTTKSLNYHTQLRENLTKQLSLKDRRRRRKITLSNHLARQ